MAFSKNWLSFLMPKLLTPIDFAKPNLQHCSIASHIPFMSKEGITFSFNISAAPLASGFILTGQ